MAVRDILIVEDQALARMYLCACVEKCADCRVAGTLTRADAALRRCGDGHIDLILMDICTENDSDGLAAAESIKKAYPHIRIVMVTSMLEGRFLERASGWGMFCPVICPIRSWRRCACSVRARPMRRSPWE